MDTNKPTFTKYQIFIVALLAFLQFTIILDFMVLSPLGAQLMQELDISASQFGWVVSSYAFAAGAAGLLAAGFADRFDRKKMLLFFYIGFLGGTLLCGLAPSYPLLLAARTLTGVFGGVIGSIVYAIVTDLFAVEVRGRVMGFVQMAFAVSQVMGLPIALYLAGAWDWHAPFLLIVGVGLPVGAVIYWRMRPVDEHLALQGQASPIEHFKHTISHKRYVRGFAATTLLATGGFMLMPFGSAFAVNNMGVALDDLPIIYLATGLVNMAVGPLVGQLADKVGSFRLFVAGTALSILMVLYYTQLGQTPLWVIIGLNCVLFVGITARMISSSTLITQVPTPADRGAFMGINASISQISGGLASALAGWIVVKRPSGYIDHYPALGWVVAASMVICVLLMRRIEREVSPPKKNADVLA